MNKSKSPSRYYNSLIFTESSVIKGTAPERHTNETLWFAKAQEIIPDNIPQIYHITKKYADGDKQEPLSYYEMQRIPGSNLFEWALENKKAIKITLDTWFKIVGKLHAKTQPVNKHDISAMYFTKPLIALRDFLFTSNINPEAITINGTSMIDPVALLESTFTALEKRLYATRGSLIHGDVTLSNTLLSLDKKLYLIDPRGMFGATRYYGDVRYDIAKMYYSLAGNFDSLNNDKYTFDKEITKPYSYRYTIYDQGFAEYGDSLIEFFQEDPELIRYIHVTIWLSLIPHMSNNHNQQMCAFLHGTSLLNALHTYE